MDVYFSLKSIQPWKHKKQRLGYLTKALEVFFNYDYLNRRLMICFNNHLTSRLGTNKIITHPWNIEGNSFPHESKIVFLGLKCASLL